LEATASLTNSKDLSAWTHDGLAAAPDLGFTVNVHAAADVISCLLMSERLVQFSFNRDIFAVIDGYSCSAENIRTSAAYV
jgi:hypothetical protein